jgi:hypothetical protein
MSKTKIEAPASKAELLANESQPCAVCGRSLGLVNVDRHHLVPKTFGGKEQYFIHRICHRKIHATFTERELEKVYNTWKVLQAHPDIANFIKWVQKKPSDYYDSTVTANRKR